MPSLYSKYVQERTGKQVIENDKGFLVYSPFKDGFLIEDIFVDPDYRHDGIATRMADMVVQEAKNMGLKTIYCTVCPTANNSTDSLKVVVAYGFKLDSCVQDLIALKKEL